MTARSLWGNRRVGYHPTTEPEPRKDTVTEIVRIPCNHEITITSTAQTAPAEAAAERTAVVTVEIGPRWIHQHVHAQSAKDIPDQDFLDAVTQAIDLTDGLPAQRWDVAAVLSGYPEHVGNLEPPVQLVPQRIVLAKARRLIQRTLLDGCTCGCRGDFELPVNC